MSTSQSRSTEKVQAPSRLRAGGIDRSATEQAKVVIDERLLDVRVVPVPPGLPVKMSPPPVSRVLRFSVRGT